MVPDSFTFHTWRTFPFEKINDLGQLACVSRLFAYFYAGTEKWFQAFDPSIEQPIKFTLKLENYKPFSQLNLLIKYKSLIW